MICHMHNRRRVFGKTSDIAFPIARHWSESIAFRAQPPLHYNHVSKSQTYVLVVSSDNNPTPNNTDWPWWFAPTKWEKGMWCLLVSYVVSKDTNIMKIVICESRPCICPKDIMEATFFIQIYSVEEVWTSPLLVRVL